MTEPQRVECQEGCGEVLEYPKTMCPACKFKIRALGALEESEESTRRARRQKAKELGVLPDPEDQEGKQEPQ